MEGWKTVQIGCVADIFDGPHATPNIVDSGAIFLGIDALDQGRINLKKTRCVTPEDYKKWTRRVTPQQGDVVFSYETRLGEAALIPEGLKCCLGRRMGLIRAKQPVLDPKFFLYYYLSPIFQEVIRLKTILGATVNRISIKEFPTFSVLLPPLEEQQSIAHILGTLDDKIELNRRQNATLEAMAQAIFKDWFVDFGPVRAKMEGRQPEGMSREIADLFPERLDDEGKPEGWKKLTIGDVFKVVGGSTPSTKEENFWKGGVYCWATPKDISRLKAPILLETERHITDEGVSIISSGLLPVGTLLLSSRAPIGYLAITKVNTAINQGIIAVYENKEISSSYMLLWCKAHMNDIFEKANGSTFQEISKSNFRTISFIFPDDKILSIGNKYINSIYEKITFNEMEINTLTSLRDSLLPKLISGELRVPDAEKMVADIV